MRHDDGELGERLAEGGEGVVREEHEADLVEGARAVLGGGEPDGVDGDARGAGHRPAVDAGGDSGERDGAGAEGAGDADRLGVGGGEDGGAVVAARVDGADGVHDPAGGQAAGGGRDRGAGGEPVAQLIGAEGPALLEAYPSGFDRSFREELQASSLSQALGSDIAVNRQRIAIDVLAARIQAGDLALLLINTQLMYGFAAPHWVLAHSVEDGVVIIDDPTISSAWGETWVDAHELPIPIEELDRMIAWGDDGYRGVVFVRRS